MTTHLIQLTDLHIRERGQLTYRRIDTGKYLEQAVQSVLALPQRPDAIVITGDLTDFGRAGEYDYVRELLTPLDGLPLYVMPGNHDDRQALRDAFPAYHYLGDQGFIQYAVDIGELRLIALDSVIPGRSEGELCGERLRWLQAALADSAGRPVVIALHHPPFRTLIGHMDKIGLVRGAPELEAVIARHPNVQRVISGHLHRSIQVGFGGTVALTAPSTAHQVCLDLAENAPSAWTLEPPGFMVHALPAGGRLVSHTAASGRFDGPHPFWDADGKLID